MTPTIQIGYEGKPLGTVTLGDDGAYVIEAPDDYAHAEILGLLTELEVGEPSRQAFLEHLPLMIDGQGGFWANHQGHASLSVEQIGDDEDVSDDEDEDETQRAAQPDDAATTYPLPDGLPPEYQHDPITIRAYQHYRAHLEATGEWLGERSDQFFVISYPGIYHPDPAPAVH